MGRRPTTGKYKTREELIEKILFYHHTNKRPIAVVASLCGVSPPTAAKIVGENSKAKKKLDRGRARRIPSGTPTTQRRSSSTDGVHSVVHAPSKPLSGKGPRDHTIIDPEQSTTIGWWCWCYQNTEHVEAPFQGQILSATGNYWKLKVGKHVVTVNRGACSTHPYPKRK